MATPFTRAEFEQMPRHVLKNGKAGNALLWHCQGVATRWVVKDFSTRAWWVRWTVGWLLTAHECRMLQRVASLPGVPQDVFRIDRFAFAMRFVEGCELKTAALTPEIFARVEQRLRELHACQVVHLDLRNARNTLLTPGDEPVFLDFQSALFTARHPRFFRDFLQRIDLSGVYKLWLRQFPDTLGPERERVLIWQLRRRRLWPFRSYRPLCYHRKLHPAEIALLEKHAGKSVAGVPALPRTGG